MAHKSTTSKTLSPTRQNLSDNIINYEVLHKTLSSTRLYNIIALVRYAI
jgi:hypothetical protein